MAQPRHCGKSADAVDTAEAGIMEFKACRRLSPVTYPDKIKPFPGESEIA
jgi:hypothetical protein